MTDQEVTLRLVDVHASYEAVNDDGAGLKGMLSGSRRRLHRVHALRGVSLEVRQGESLGIVGSNGSGKSTLLAAMTGLLPVDQGEVWVRSRPTLLGVGAVMRPSLSGRRNIVIGGLALGLSLAEVRQEMEGIIEFSGLEDSIDLPMRTYSSGMRARLMFAIATSKVPEILLIDEALAVGDAEFAQRSQSRIDTIRNRAGSVILVSHNSRELRDSCDRVVWLERGELVESGDPDAVIDAYEAHVRNRVSDRLLVTDQLKIRPTPAAPTRGPVAADRTLTFHIGSKFTTLPIQRYLTGEEARLKEAGISIPSYLGLRSHYPFGAATIERAAKNLPVDVRRDWRSWRDDFVATARAKMDDGNDWIVSSELIGIHLGPEAVLALRELAAELGFTNAKALLYVQRPDRLAARSHVDAVLSGSLDPFSIDDEVERVARHDWQRLYEWWTSPGSFDVVVRLFPDGLDRRDVVADFIDAMGLPDADTQQYLGEPTLSAEAVAFVQRMAAHDETEVSNRGTVARIARLLASTTMTPFSLTRAESARLMSTFEQSNAFILDKVAAHARRSDYFTPNEDLPRERPELDWDHVISFSQRLARAARG